VPVTVTERGRAALTGPTVQTILAVVGMYLLQLGLRSAGVGTDAFVLRLPVSQRPWTLVTTVYAHAGVIHLGTNVAVLALVGLLVEARITRAGFHALFLSAGVLAAGSVVLAGAAIGVPVGAIGASGAVFALVGYGVTAPAAPGRRSTPASGPGSDRPRAHGVGRPPSRGPPRLSLFGFGTILVFGPLVVGVAPLEVLGHAVGFAIGLGVGAVSWPGETEV